MLQELDHVPERVPAIGESRRHSTKQRRIKNNAGLFEPREVSFYIVTRESDMRDPLRNWRLSGPPDQA